MRHRDRWPLTIVAGCVLAACGGNASEAPADAPSSSREALQSCDTTAARRIVEQFGSRLKQVSLLAPDSVLAREMRQAYGPLVTPALLETWMSTPSRAPGRRVSSPWPERIEVRSIETSAAGACRVDGDVVYMTSAGQAPSAPASRERVSIQVTTSGGGQISTYETSTGPSTSSDSPRSDADALSDVIESYYAAIEARDFRRAYNLWADDGAASGQTLQLFAAGFRHTARVQVDVGMPSRVEPAAGSRYAEVPVVVRAVSDSGVEQRFEGKYVLRRSVVDGATAAQRRWHIYSADIARAR